jgi:hypothetical protein
MALLDAAVRSAAVVLVVAAAGCATRNARAPSAPGAPAGGEAMSPQREPEIVRNDARPRLSLADAVARYRKGSSCAGSEAPEVVIGAPEQRNVMQVGRERVITYGWRFPEGRLFLRCRADRVELARTLK